MVTAAREDARPRPAGPQEPTKLGDMPGRRHGGAITTDRVMALIHTPTLDEKAAAAVMAEVLAAW